MTLENIFDMQRQLAALVEENNHLILKMMEGYKKIPDEELLDTADVMRIFKKTERTIYTWRMRGELPFIIRGGTVYFLKSEVYKLLKMKEETSV